MFPFFQGCDIIHAAGKYFLRIRYIESFCSGEISPGQLADQQSKVIFSYWELEHHRKILRTSIKTQCATTVVTTSLSSTTTKYCRVVKHQKLANHFLAFISISIVTTSFKASYKNRDWKSLSPGQTTLLLPSHPPVCPVSERKEKISLFGWNMHP